MKLTKIIKRVEFFFYRVAKALGYNKKSWISKEMGGLDFDRIDKILRKSIADESNFSIVKDNKSEIKKLNKGN